MAKIKLHREYSDTIEVDVKHWSTDELIAFYHDEDDGGYEALVEEAALAPTGNEWSIGTHKGEFATIITDRTGHHPDEFSDDQIDAIVARVRND